MKTEIFGHLVVTQLGHMCKREENGLNTSAKNQHQLTKTKTEFEEHSLFIHHVCSYRFIMHEVLSVFSVQIHSIRLIISRADTPEMTLLLQAAPGSSLSHQKHAELKRTYGNDYVLYSLNLNRK